MVRMLISEIEAPAIDPICTAQQSTSECVKRPSTLVSRAPSFFAPRIAFPLFRSYRPICDDHENIKAFMLNAAHTVFPGHGARNTPALLSPIRSIPILQIRGGHMFYDGVFDNLDGMKFVSPGEC